MGPAVAKSPVSPAILALVALSLTACVGDIVPEDRDRPPIDDLGPWIRDDAGPPSGPDASIPIPDGSADPVPADDAGLRVDAGDPADGGTDADAGAGCVPPVIPVEPTGAVHEVRAGESIAAALAAAAAGDVVQIRAGSYPELRILDVIRAAPVFVRAAPGESVTIAGLTIDRSSQVFVRDVSIAGRIVVDRSEHVELARLAVDPGSAATSGNTVDVGRSHDVAIVDSRIARGVRTIVLFSGPVPATEWLHAVRIEGNELWGGDRCVHVIGARDVTIAHNVCRSLDPSDWPVGVQLSGSQDVRIEGNDIRGPEGARIGVGITIGMVHEMIAGAEHLTVTRTTIANNLVRGFAEEGILIEGASDTTVVHNTSWDNGTTTTDRPGFRTQNRAGGNPGLSLWNNLFESIALDATDVPLAFESNDMVASGAAAAGRIVADPMFVDHERYELAGGSPAIDAGLAREGAPDRDVDGLLRAGAPDLGARERGGAAPMVCE